MLYWGCNMTLIEYLRIWAKLSKEFMDNAFDKGDKEMFSFYHGQFATLTALIAMLTDGKVEL